MMGTTTGDGVAKGKPVKRGPMRWVKAKPRGWYPDSVVEQVIKEYCNGNAAELERKLIELSRKKLSKQQVAGWRQRGQFPIEWIEYIHSITRLPYTSLLPRQRPRS